jgi:hypothetical protein
MNVLYKNRAKKTLHIDIIIILLCKIKAAPALAETAL